MTGIALGLHNLVQGSPVIQGIPLAFTVYCRQKASHEVKPFHFWLKMEGHLYSWATCRLLLSTVDRRPAMKSGHFTYDWRWKAIYTVGPFCCLLKTEGYLHSWAILLSTEDRKLTMQCVKLPPSFRVSPKGHSVWPLHFPQISFCWKMLFDIRAPVASG